MEILRAICKSPLLGVLSRVFIGSLFVVAAIIKMQDPHGFATSISNYHLLPQSLWYPLALFLPCLEAICGILLIIGFWIEDASIVIGFMLIVFLTAIISAYLRGIQIDCGCFGSKPSGKSDMFIAILRDIGLLLLVLQIMVSKPTWKSILPNLSQKKVE